MRNFRSSKPRGLRMREFHILVLASNKLHDLAQAVEEGDHRVVEPPVLEHARDGVELSGTIAV